MVYEVPSEQLRLLIAKMSPSKSYHIRRGSKNVGK